MTRTSQVILGALPVVVGLLLALVWPSVEFLWFRGRPLGVVLAVVGVLDLLAGLFGTSADRRR